jgi:septum formation protein
MVVPISAELVLASASPRRAELLRQLGCAFVVRPAEVDESPHPQELPMTYLERIVASKLHAALPGNDMQLVLCADTLVHRDGQIFDKPASPAAQRAALQSLAGSVHTVSTRFALAHAGRSFAQTVSTSVHIASMSAAEIEAYLATGEGVGKAGGYAIQGVFARYVARVDGSYTGVVGLPLHQVALALTSFGVLV